jgi:hypothetical protein
MLFSIYPEMSCDRLSPVALANHCSHPVDQIIGHQHG